MANDRSGSDCDTAPLGHRRSSARATVFKLKFYRKQGGFDYAPSKSSTNSETGSTPVTINSSLARVHAT